MKKTILLLTLFAAILLPAANLIQNPATGQFRSGTVPEGITATIRNDAGFITVDGGEPSIHHSPAAGTGCQIPAAQDAHARH